MATHHHSRPGDGASARRTPVETLHSGAEPLEYSRVPGVEFPAVVYSTIVAAFAAILLASWLVFGTGAEADLGLGIATVLCVVFFALPVILCRTAAARFSARRKALDDFLSAPVETATCTLTGSQVWLQVLIIPLTLAIAAILIGAVCVIVA